MKRCKTNQERLKNQLWWDLIVWAHANTKPGDTLRGVNGNNSFLNLSIDDKTKEWLEKKYDELCRALR